MKRRDFFKRLGIGVAAIMAAPMVMAKAIETKHSDNWHPLTSDKWRILTKEDWQHLTIYSDKVYINGHYNRQLTPIEIKSIYNDGLPLTYKELFTNNLMPDKIMRAWIRRIE